MGDFSIRFVTFTSTLVGLVGWLILRLPGVGWGIMGYESEPLPSYHDLRNCSYSIKLSYTIASSTPQVRLLRLGPTIAPTGSSPACAPPPCTAHRWGGRTPFLLWFPSAFWCTPRRCGALRISLTPLPMDTPNLCLPQLFPTSLWSVSPPGGGTPPGPWASPPSPPISCCQTRAPTGPLPYTPLPGPTPFPLSFPAPSIPFPTASDISTGFDITPPNL